MDKVFYRGLPYTYKVTEVGGKKMFALYTGDVMQHFIAEEDLDKRSLVSRLLDLYYKGDPVNEGSNMPA